MTAAVLPFDFVKWQELVQAAFIFFFSSYTCQCVGIQGKENVCARECTNMHTYMDVCVLGKAKKNYQSE